VPAEAAVAVNNLNYSYADGRTALHGISFQVAPGETVGLVGPNGAGKTTLFLCLSGVLAVPKGRIQVSGLDPGLAADRRKLPTVVGIVFQNSDDQIFHATVFDDVAFGPLNLGMDKNEIHRRVAAALDQVGLKNSDQRVPFHLSGGEKRRVAIAGVLAMSPGVLLLDEPSMYLDPRGRRDLKSLLQDLPVTKIIATHDLEFVLEVCTRVLVIDQGRLFADGPPCDLLADIDLMDRHGLEVPHSLRKAAVDM
jgi:cobalt/nickel transport system ATP-binding protein